MSFTRAECLGKCRRSTDSRGRETVRTIIRLPYIEAKDTHIVEGRVVERSFRSLYFSIMRVLQRGGEKLLRWLEACLAEKSCASFLCRAWIELLTKVHRNILPVRETVDPDWNLGFLSTSLYFKGF